jgi:ferredoxin-NADP reductase
VAGGMGITPHLLMLQQILINDTHSVGPTAMRLTVSLIWCVREPTTLEVFVHDLHALKAKLAQAYPNIAVDVRIFCTVKDDPVGKAQLAPNPYVRTMNIVCHKRADFDAELDSLAAAWAPHVQKAAAREAKNPAAAVAADGSQKKPKSEAEIANSNYSVGTYVSGPEEFTAAATAALKKKRGDFAFHVHTESFRL